MKIYIAGKISGLPEEMVQQKFEKAETEIRDLGYQPVSPLNNGLPYEAEWEEHLARDLALMKQCDALYLLLDWQQSAGARLEGCIARGCGMKIYLQADGQLPKAGTFEAEILRIERAVSHVTGIPFSVYAAEGSDREQAKVYARMLYAASCKRVLGIGPTAISRRLPRKPSMVSTYLKNYSLERDVNPAFRRLASALEKQLQNE